MRYLITGSSGFVGHYLIELLNNTCPEIEIYATARSHTNFSNNHFIKWTKLELNDYDQLCDLIKSIQPNNIVHLAAESSVAFSWKNPTKSYRNNVNIFLNLLEAVRTTKVNCRILAISSSECYGRVGAENIPLRESCKLNPISPYAIARVSQEMLTKLYVDNYNLDIITSRSFNHIGPNQDSRFVIPSFIHQLILRKKTKTRDALKCGDLSVIRDFVDVRDVVKAYLLLLKKGEKGEVYNICSGQGYSLHQILEMLSEYIEIKVNIEQDPSLVRPNDNPIIIGDHSKITSICNWRPKIALEDSLKDIINHVSQNV
ncbi:MAG: GDP-mannose 4,6-dehydratase [Saprospiraceae bacterium]